MAAVFNFIVSETAKRILISH